MSLMMAMRMDEREFAGLDEGGAGNGHISERVSPWASARRAGIEMMERRALLGMKESVYPKPSNARRSARVTKRLDLRREAGVFTPLWESLCLPTVTRMRNANGWLAATNCGPQLMARSALDDLARGGH